jgi:hypothetical protein
MKTVVLIPEVLQNKQWLEIKTVWKVTNVFTTNSAVWRNTAIVRFQLNTGYNLEVKETQFRLLSTTLLMFSAALYKDMNSQYGPR